MKTIETLDIEQTLYAYCREQGQLVVEEVSLPDDQGIVDTLSRDTQGRYTCFELKVTKADFHSKAKLSFIGDYNYFVLPRHLIAQVAAEVPSTVGILVFDYFDAQLRQLRHLPNPGILTVYRKAPQQPLKLKAAQIELRFIHSLNREVDKAKRLTSGLRGYHSQQLVQELKRRAGNHLSDTLTDNFYTTLMADYETTALAQAQAEIAALKAELTQTQLQLWQLSQHQPKLPLNQEFTDAL
ncbi:hypothetical protein ACNAN0_10385 [Agrilactobacillus fermenti]|uniref:hypothetical protein n=1 Tax=Agrilactobacillus fermenti TaxID=2586909 RepID=UPI001E31098F|nr:hypothetical protein [Agrilactobacillus fermenti]MCD2256831.1 hypothetical protein [Agrilactobacillus fermenti]